MGNRVLVVEDEPDLRLLWRSILAANSYSVVDAETGRAGLEAARTQQPDLILLDGHLPDLSGWEVLDLIAGDDLLRRIPVVMVTADTGQDTRSIEGGAAGCLTKPVSMSELLETVGRLLARAGT